MTLAEADKLPSRRALLAAAGSAAGVAALTGCGAKPLRETIRGSGPVPAADVPVLDALLAVEQYAVVAYAAAIPLMGPKGERVGRQFLTQEMAHVVELRDMIKRAHGKPRKPEATYNLGRPRYAYEARVLLVTVEHAQLRVYLEMIPHLTGGRVRAAATTIFANQAQHLAVLRTLEDQPPVPAAFVTG